MQAICSNAATTSARHTDAHDTRGLSAASRITMAPSTPTDDEQVLDGDERSRRQVDASEDGRA